MFGSVPAFARLSLWLHACTFSDVINIYLGINTTVSTHVLIALALKVESFGMHTLYTNQYLCACRFH